MDYYFGLIEPEIMANSDGWEAFEDPFGNSFEYRLSVSEGMVTLQDSCGRYVPIDFTDLESMYYAVKELRKLTKASAIIEAAQEDGAKFFY